MSVTRLDNGRWRAKVKAGRVNVASKVFDTKREAVMWERLQKSLLAGGVDVRAGKKARIDTTFKQWLREREGTVAESTWKTDLAVFKQLPTTILARPVGEITTHEVQGHIKGLKTSSGRKERVKITLSAFFSWCVREGLRDSNPVKGVRVATGVREVSTPFTWAQIDEIVPLITQECYRNLVMVASATGLRWGELRGLLARDVTASNSGVGLAINVVRSHSDGCKMKDVKQSLVRTVPVPHRAVQALTEATKGKSINQRVFTSPGGGLISKSNFRRDAWNMVRNGHSIHDLRHTAISEWVARGIPLSLVQQWAGHDSLSTTNKYVHASACYAVDFQKLLA